MMNILKLIGLNEENTKYNPHQDAAVFGTTDPKIGKSYKKKRILVYFLGGISFAEIAALRFL